MGCSSSMLHQADVMWTSVRRVQPRTECRKICQSPEDRAPDGHATARAVLGVRLVRPPDNIRRAPDRTRVTLLPAHSFDKCQLDISQVRGTYPAWDALLGCSSKLACVHTSHFFALFSASAAFLRAVFLEAFSACVGEQSKGSSGASSIVIRGHQLAIS